MRSPTKFQQTSTKYASLEFISHVVANHILTYRYTQNMDNPNCNYMYN